MSSATVEHPLKMGNSNKKENENTKACRISHATQKKHKEDNRHPKFNRKRVQSFTSNGKFFPPYKRRKKDSFIPPTKFLLGGNICDPLNLNSMQDEEVNRAMNAVTPKSSPLPTPKHRKGAVEVIIPLDPSDPLNLNNVNNDEYEKHLLSPLKRNGKKRNRVRNRKKSIASSLAIDQNKTEEVKKEEPVVSEVVQVSEKVEEKMDVQQPQKDPTPPKSPAQEPPRPKEESPIKEPKLKLKIKFLDDKEKRIRKLDIMDKIVSPVIPQPGAWRSRPPYRPNHHDKKKKQKQPNFKDKNARFQYGNYNRYYGYRNHQERDSRLTVFSQRKELFFQKDVLDVGCNIGHITLSVAREFAARSVTGIDIDKKLIGIARKNVKHYVNCAQSPVQTDDVHHKENDANIFPMSMLINYGPVDIPGFENPNKHKGFPYNVSFVQGNYDVEDDLLLSVNQKHHFDTILCLSVTKWIHLNSGDDGLKRCFKRMYAQLKPGGVLILEPQNWNSYTKKKTLTEKIYKNFHTIELKPDMFTQYLLSPEVGFKTCEVISVPPHPSKGFQRPIYLYGKAQHTPSAVETSPPPSTSMEVTAAEDCSDANADATRVERRPSVELQERGRRPSYDQQEKEREEMERDLFPSDARQVGNFSDRSQRSNESFCNYDQLENVYAPSATPCYDTPSHNSATSPFSEPERMCYADINIDNYQPSKIELEERKSSEENLEQEENVSPNPQEDKTRAT